jgi:hypothetical protein
MLEAITDFWKPTKKVQVQDQVRPDDLVVGSTIGFGFVPQVSLSGQRLKITAINTYKFGQEALTSYALSQEGASVPSATMIFADSDGEYYLAISRRIAPEDRAKLFDLDALGAMVDSQEIIKLACRDNVPEFKGWLVANYKREIQGMKGLLYQGDFRKSQLPDAALAQSFSYMLLVSDSNEQAIEIEKYADGRLEVYATVYRRMSDIGEVSYSTVVPLNSSPTPTITATFSDAVEAKVQPKSEPKIEATPEPKTEVKVEPKIEPKVEAKLEPKIENIAESKVLADETAKSEPIHLKELSAEKLVNVTVPVLQAKDTQPAEVSVIKPQPKFETGNADKPVTPLVAQPVVPAIKLVQEEKVLPTETIINGDNMNNGYAENTDLKPKLTAVVANPAAPEAVRPEVRAVSSAQPSLSSDAIECDLRVANKIIDEAIRNEMRLADVVRRIIELPVANPESVQIPMTLTDEDYSLLAIRYGISAGDKNAIKRRIIDELNDFSGKKKAVAA